MRKGGRESCAGAKKLFAFVIVNIVVLSGEENSSPRLDPISVMNGNWKKNLINCFNYSPYLSSPLAPFLFAHTSQHEQKG